MKISFDKAVIDRQIQAFKDMHNRDPYLICSEKTFYALPETKNEKYITIFNNSIMLSNGNEPESKGREEHDANKVYITSKVFIDNGLEVGEIIFA